VDDGILRLSDTRGAFIEAEGVTVDLDQRWRLQVPYGIRATTGLHPGVRVIALTTVDCGLVVLPAYRLLPNAETDGIS
jgi:bifunctional DNA-binding transcriptional regulator/antitoxin component of YhaV-PrlF toxin-antitoxin module